MSGNEGTAVFDIPTCAGDVGGLVIGAADGDDWAWQRLVSHFSDLVASVAGAHRLNEEDVARVSAKVWQRLGGDLGRIRRPDRVGAWLGAVTRDECVKALGTVHDAA
jgi:hypothetical protein